MQIGSIFNEEAMKMAKAIKEQNFLGQGQQKYQAPQAQIQQQQPQPNVIQSFLRNINWQELAVKNPQLIGLWQKVKQHDPISLFYTTAEECGINKESAEKFYNLYNERMMSALNNMK